MHKSWRFYFYLILSIVLWLLVGMIIHWLLEMPVLYFLGSDYYRYSLGLDYGQWMALHDFMTVVVWLAALVWGIYFGLHWYERIYLHSSQHSSAGTKVKKRTAKTKRK